MKNKGLLLLPIMFGFLLLYVVMAGVVQETAVLAQVETAVADEPEFMKQIGGFAYSAAKRGNHLFMGMGTSLTVLDVQDPADSQLVSKLGPLESPVRELHLFGDYGVSPGSSQLRVFDLQDPLSPQLVHTYTVSSQVINDVEISGTLAFVAEEKIYGELSGSGGVRILDMSDPLNIQQIGHYGDGYTVYALGIYGNILHAEICKFSDGTSCLPGPAEIDITDPSTPTEISFENGNTANDLEVYDHYLIRNVTDDGSAIQIIDLSAPGSDPVILSNAATELVVADNKLFALFYYGKVDVYDLTEPVTPTLSGMYYNNLYTGPFDADADNGNVYLAWGGRGLQILDTSQPTLPQVGEYDTFGQPVDALWVENYVYLLDWSQDLHVLDVADPLNPVEVNRINHPYFDYKMIRDNDLLFLQGHFNFEIFDVSEPISPTKRDVYTTTNYGSVSGLIVDGNYAYVSLNETIQESLEVVDVTDPDNPILVGSSGGPPPCLAAVDMEMVGEYLYLAEEAQCTGGPTEVSSQLSIIDVSNPVSPTIAATYPITGSYSLNATALIGDYLYVAHNTYGIRILDVSNPLAPQEAGLYSIPDSTGYGYRVTAVNNQLYVSAELTNGEYTYQILDVSNPTMPVQFGEYQYINQLNVGTYKYYLGSQDGLLIYSNPDMTSIFLPVIHRSE